MSKHARSFTPAPDGTVTLNTGLKAFQSSPEFRGPVEDVDGHGCNDHFAQIYETDEERFAAAVPFVRHGLERGERVMYVIDKSSEEEVTAALRNGGIDVDTARESGALSFHTVQETYLRNGKFAPDEMIDFYAETVAAATDEYTALRIVAETTWLQDDSTTVPDFMEYEAKINELFAETESLAICQYDRRGFPPEVIRDIVRSHPHLIYDGTVCHNFYYTPPAEFFTDDDAEREVNRMLGTLRDRATAKTQLQQRERFLQDLYAITAEPDRAFDDKLQAVLGLGCKQFGFDLGGMAKIDPATDRFEVEHSNGDNEHLVPGAEVDLSETYCRVFADADTADPVADPVEIREPAANGFTDEACVTEFGVTTYLGTRIAVEGGDDRTLFFAATEPRDTPVSAAHRTIHKLMGQWVKHELERRQHEQFLREFTAITASQDRSFEEKLDALFELGCDQFDLDLGGVNRVDSATDYFEVEYISGDHTPFEEGGELPLSQTYCQAAADIRAAAAVTDPAAEGYDDITVYEEFDIGGYLGTYIPVEGDTDRTLAFVPDGARERPFTERDKAYVELMGQWIGYELNRRQREQFLQRSYEITSDPTRSFDEKVQALLDLGSDQFGLEMGGLNYLPEWDSAFRLEKEIGLDVDPEEELWTDPDNDCYCRRTVSDDEPVGVPDVRGTHWTEDAIYRELGMTSYLGTTVETGAQSYGTLWFGSTEPRDRPFSDAERSFIDLMAQWIGYEIERRQRKQAQRDLYEIIADTGLDTDTKVDRLLGVGSDYLDLPIGMLNCDAGDALEIEHLHGDHPELAAGGYTPPESEHYCRETVDTGSPVMVADTAAAGWDDDPLCNDIGLAAYAGAPVTVGDEPYGTLCFAATSPRRAAFTDGERTFLDLLGQCVGYELERARREARLHALSSLGQALLDTESTAEVGECTVEAAGHACDMPVAAAALYDDETGALTPVATSPAAAELLEEVAVFDAPDGAAWDAFVTGDTTCRQAVAMDAPEAPSVTELVAHPLGNHGVFVFGTTDPYGFRDGDRDVIATAAAHVRAALARADRERQLQEREQVLEEQNETLARLNRVNDTIRSVDQALVEARTRDEIERVVCEELADRGPYELAWIGEYDGAIGEVTPVTSAGTDKGYLDRITVTADDTQEGCGPTGRAIKTGDPQVVNDVISDESFAPWRQDALNRGFHASAALPLTYDDSRYGVLNLYAGQPDVFDDLEREVLTELSNTVAHAINAVESKKSLVSPTVDELEFEVTDDALASVAMSRALDCDVELKRLVSRDDGRINMFFAVDGATPDEVLAFQSQLPTTDIRLVSEGDDGSPCLFEAELTDESLGQTVTDHGGRLRRVRIEDGVAQVTVRLGQDADTREFVEMFQTKYLDSELVANRTRQLSHRTPFEFAQTMMEDLTDRQREVLETAYVNGYFEEPRNRTASEIADIMDIAQPTFNSHLRAAMRKVYRRIFEDELAAQ